MNLPRTKREELLSLLIHSLRSGDYITIFKLKNYLVDIEKHSTGLEMAHLKALAYGLAKDIKNAEHFFELSLQIKNTDYAINYLAYMSDHASIEKTRILSKRFYQEYACKGLIIPHYDMSIIRADIASAEDALNKLIKLSMATDAQKFRDSFMIAKGKITKFITSANLTQEQMLLISDSLFSVFAMHGIKSKDISVNYLYDNYHDEIVNLYIITIKCNDTDKLSEMNGQLAYKLAEHDDLIGKNFSVWIRGMENNEKRSVHCL